MPMSFVTHPPSLIAMLAATLLAAGCRPPSPRPDAEVAVPVEIAAVDAGDLPSTFEAGGIVRARTTAAVASRLLAPVVRVHVHAGDRVARGAALVTLEGGALAALSAGASATAGASEEAVRAAEGAAQAAEASLVLARATQQRVRVLHEKRSATPQELDQATASLDAATAQLTSARAGLAGAIASRTAAGDAARAAAVASSYAVLTAPFAGVVTERTVDPGDVALPGARLLTLEADGDRRLEVSLDEARAGLVERGQRVAVALGDAAAASWVMASVAEIARVDPATHGFLVKIDLPAAVSARSGTFGRARFEGPPRAGLWLPASAVVRRGQLTFVYVVTGTRHARLQPVTVATRTDDRVDVLAGVEARERVVLRPPLHLSDGALVSEARP